MPCTKCKNNKYKWGKTGKCKYDSKEACEKANKKNYNKMRPTPLGKTYEQYEKELKEYKEIKLSKVERVELGLAQDLKRTAEATEGSLKTADKVIDIADKVNSTIKNLSSDVKFYNKYKELVEKDLESAVKRLKSLKSEAEKGAKDLGLDVKDIDGYKEAQASLYKSENALKGIENTRMDFDI
tara:strand:- start:1857 stop:2405 length:549 start_codon:yes stop_codon:yes gene_type:complete